MTDIKGTKVFSLASLHHQFNQENVQRKRHISLKKAINGDFPYLSNQDLPLINYYMDCEECGVNFDVAINTAYASCPRCEEVFFIPQTEWESKKMKAIKRKI